MDCSYSSHDSNASHSLGSLATPRLVSLDAVLLRSADLAMPRTRA